MAKERVVVIQLKDKFINKLIDDGLKLDKEIKDKESRLKGIKTELEALTTGKYQTPKGAIVTISTVPTYTDIDPEKAKKALRAKRLGKNFLSCVKVAVTALGRHLSPDELETLREVKEQSRRYSFR